MPAKTAATRHNLSRNKTKNIIMATKQQTAELVLEALNDMASKKNIGKEASVVREGNKIIIPDGMSYDNAITWIQRKKESEEKVVAIYDTIQCYPLDGSVAVMNAIKDIYGFTSLTNTPGFFGSNPPLLVQVPLADGTFETALIGRIAIPKWEGGYIDLGVGREANITINGQIKKKFESEVKEVIAAARERLQSSSIYKGKAVRVDLAFMHGERDFHPINDSPAFFDVANVDESMLILNEVTDLELRANVFLLIERTAECVANNVPLKHGCLLMGRYGTGKTLTAKVLGNKCVRHGWTFIYLKNAAHLAEALRLAKLYSPAVVFAEDIDQVLNDGRTEKANNILNTIDGVDTKDTPIITILTTNNPDNIEPAFLRAGRMDTIIEFEAPDAKTAVRFVEKLAVDDDCQSLLAPGTDLTEVGREMDGFVPAFINEAIQQAKKFAMHREGKDIVGKVTTHDLVVAAKAKQKHIARVNKPTDKTKEQKLHDAVQLMGNTMNDHVMTGIGVVKRAVENL